MIDFTLDKDILRDGIECGNFPSYLYKYRDDSASTELIFKDFTLWFSTPQSFNDPFDCNLSEVSSHSQEDANQFLKHFLEGRYGGDKEISRGISIKQAENLLESAKKETLSKTGLLCLSKRLDSILMWSHYANSHKGLVIELDISQDLDFFIAPIQVNYTDSYEPTNYFKDQWEAVTKILSIKSNIWSYEEEIRVLKNNKCGAVSFNPKVIRRVIFGCKSEPDFILRIRNLCSLPELKHVTFSKLEIPYAKFALEISVLAT